MVPIVELADAGGCAGGDQITRAQRETAGEKTDMIAQPANHIAGMRRHRFFAVLQNFYCQILRFIDLIPGHDPWTQSAESIESFANIARVLHAFSPGIALADVPADGITKNIIERLFFSHFTGPFADDGAELALEINELGNFRQNYCVTGPDDGRRRLEEELGHQFVFAFGDSVCAAHALDHLFLVRPVICRRSPQ